MTECGLRTCDVENRCGRFTRNPAAPGPGDCVQCWMYEYHPAYREKCKGPPSLAQKAANVTKAALRWLVHGAQRVDNGTLAVRKRACEGDPQTPACPKFKNGWCELCGCILNYKQQMKTEQCPIGRWPQ